MAVVLPVHRPDNRPSRHELLVLAKLSVSISRLDGPSVRISTITGRGRRLASRLRRAGTEQPGELMPDAMVAFATGSLETWPVGDKHGPRAYRISPAFCRMPAAIDTPGRRTMFQAVEIGGEAYWDGGYAGNPTITPLVRECESSDTILVQVNPVERPETPRTARAILDRVNEVAFNTALLKELRMIALLRQVADPGDCEGALWARMRVHRINGGGTRRSAPPPS